LDQISTWHQGYEQASHRDRRRRSYETADANKPSR
jgi:hypothetical protein